MKRPDLEKRHPSSVCRSYSSLLCPCALDPLKLFNMNQELGFIHFTYSQEIQNRTLHIIHSLYNCIKDCEFMLHSCFGLNQHSAGLARGGLFKTPSSSLLYRPHLPCRIMQNWVIRATPLIRIMQNWVIRGTPLSM